LKLGKGSNEISSSYEGVFSKTTRQGLKSVELGLEKRGIFRGVTRQGKENVELRAKSVGFGGVTWVAAGFKGSSRL
jgi:hypothetical protein